MVFNLSYDQEISNLFESRTLYDTSRPVLVKYEKLTSKIIELLATIAKEFGAFRIEAYDKLPTKDQMQDLGIEFSGRTGIDDCTDYRVTFKDVAKSTEEKFSDYDYEDPNAIDDYEPYLWE